MHTDALRAAQGDSHTPELVRMQPCTSPDAPDATIRSTRRNFEHTPRPRNPDRWRFSEGRRHQRTDPGIRSTDFLEGFGPYPSSALALCRTIVRHHTSSIWDAKALQNKPPKPPRHGITAGLLWLKAALQGANRPANWRDRRDDS